MTTRRALVSQTRFPEIDRDTGSQRVDMFTRWLLERDWSVTFLATASDSEPRNGHRLQQLGIPTYVGLQEAEGIAAAGDFDLALLAFWEPASRLLPVLRAVSPEARVVIDSIDVHFLRAARRLLGAEANLDAGFGAGLASELNAYRWADAVLTVSSHEARLLGDLLGPQRIHDIPLAMAGRRSPIPFDERSGIVFIGNFRHLPNGEAVEFLCRDVLPRLDPDLLAEHPVEVIGSRLDARVAAHADGLPNVRMVGWVPSVQPYIERARVCVVPLLHGAGVKGKVVESLLAGTPVVTTTIGAEGTDLRHGDHVLIADTPEELAGGIAQLLTDRPQWERLADAGFEQAAATHAPERVAERFDEMLERVLAAPPRWHTADDTRTGRTGREAAYRDMSSAIASALHSLTSPGASVLVVSHGDDALLACEGRRVRHFPQGADGGWAGFVPANSAEAIEHLEILREGGARYLVVPSSEFWWLHNYSELTAHLEATYRRIYADDDLILFDLAPEPRPAIRHRRGRKERVMVIGSYDAARRAPPARLVEELGRSERFDLQQRWEPRETARTIPANGYADWILHIDADAVLPSRFVDDFLGVLASLHPLGVERAQPPHISGPDAGPPVTERLHGILGRGVEGVTPLPVTAVRAGCEREGPTVLVDAVPIALGRPIRWDEDPLDYSSVRDVFMPGEDWPRRAVHRSHGADVPRISVLISTYERPALLAGCLEGFCEQTLPASQFEVVVVDDGSPGAETQQVLADFAERLPLTWTRIDHSGRSAAKNLALLLARGELVLFFDDDDRPDRDLLAEHVRAHSEHPDEATAILGHTGWDPGLEVSPLMHYLTEVDRLLFAYGNFEPGERIDWRGFWEGRVSSKRSLHLRHGLHDQRLEYSIDVELAWRLRDQGLEVVYYPAARSVMSRSIGFDEFRRRFEAKGRAQAAIASLHDHPAIREYTKIEDARARWEAAQPELPRLMARIPELEQALHGRGNGAAPPESATAALHELHRCYRDVFFAHNAKGIADVLGETGASLVAAAGGTGSTSPAPSGPNGSSAGEEPPALSIVMPVWSRTQELADMAVRAIERVWEVARMPTEVIVIDNASPVEVELPAQVHRFPFNRGVATAWNTGIQLSRAPVIAVLNSDCFVEPGWDEALHEAAITGRRIAFPYTDHCDGEGFRQPDQGGTAGWCFMLMRDLWSEIGPFDEWFSPAYGEDTDYWHRAWQMGVQLAPVPAARVTHARRTSITEDDRHEWLLLAHRYKYGWKHGVEPLRAPPYYNREIVEYHCTGLATSPAPKT